MAASSLISELRSSLTDESARIQREFESTGVGRAALRQRTRLVEEILARLWRDIVSPDPAQPSNFALVATGGFGRGWMFPYSDIDLLFLFGDRNAEQTFKDPVRRFSQELWDLRLKLSPASRLLGECDRYDANNTEFTISLLDCRYLAGDRDLFRRLHDKVIPKLVMRESKALLQGLAEVTRERHAKYGMTLYHLEPNLKEAPGGLRDCNVASWLALISAMDKLHDWPDASSLRAPVRKQLESALDFLMAARCFLHFRHGVGRHRTRRPRERSGRQTRKQCQPPIGCGSISGMRARCSAPSLNCSKKFQKRGQHCTGRCKAGGRD
ncbi:MAG: hypothetical protein DMG79_16265 [Acidobacteria bacterium]|nr:MAG: hypothetical protein DMG79_16265 [Acidobacteriota bacterium]